MRLLKNATNCFGKVGPAVQERIQVFIDRPGYETWDAIYGIILTPTKRCNCSNRKGCNTVWQAVIAIDPTFPRSGSSGATAAQRWRKFPDAMTVARAIKHATGD